ncbi:VOC family protein [Mycobacterium arosiense]|uniref:Glyoxalase n=1 Tax=Mycobacterium arosiense ATCC BAA-1401 = DSM 45069 TaxID=1265311 RepID=A0A1W9ZQ08_MYCAI|nr:VOC family protein [Mycobacterium arosiense]ORA19922.1 glyoxalase [Mycobacterium arosiense ATCC BAA-1401 = DSM 45069]
MASEDLARRFLHVNLNCESLDATERLYSDVLGLSARMRTDPTVPTNGAILGIDDETYCSTAFLYDARGGRKGCALEAIAFESPPLSRDQRTEPTRPGIRATLMWVADLDNAIVALRDSGLSVGDPVDGLISGAKSVLALDPDGVVIELAQAPGDLEVPAGALFSGIRIAAIHALATAEFLTAIGFVEVEAPTTERVSGSQLTPTGSADSVQCVVARFALPEDGHRFTVTVVQHPETATDAPVPWGGNRQGLYRCALRVENVEKALAAMPNSVERVGDPVWCPLPGTKIDGLHIAFLRSPDGVVFEFVERPLKFFST